MMQVVRWALLSILLSHVSLAWADAGPMTVSSPGSVGPKKQTRVQMIEEEVVLSDIVGGLASYPEVKCIGVHAEFLFQNKGDDDEKVGIFFPMCDLLIDEKGDYEQCIAQNRVQVTVDGKKKGHWFDKRLMNGVYGEDSYWGVVRFNAHFPVGKVVRVTVDYFIEEEYGNKEYLRPSMFFRYLLSTGAGWDGPIGKGMIIVKLPFEASHRSVQLHSKVAKSVVNDGKRLVWRFENLEPTTNDDLRIEIARPRIVDEISTLEKYIEENPDSVPARFVLVETLWQSALPRSSVNKELLRTMADLRVDVPAKRRDELMRLYWKFLEGRNTCGTDYYCWQDYPGELRAGYDELMAMRFGLEPRPAWYYETVLNDVNIGLWQRKNGWRENLYLCSEYLTQNPDPNSELLKQSFDLPEADDDRTRGKKKYFDDCELGLGSIFGSMFGLDAGEREDTGGDDWHYLWNWKVEKVARITRRDTPRSEIKRTRNVLKNKGRKDAETYFWKWYADTHREEFDRVLHGKQKWKKLRNSPQSSAQLEESEHNDSRDREVNGVSTRQYVSCGCSSNHSSVHFSRSPIFPPTFEKQ